MFFLLRRPQRDVEFLHQRDSKVFLDVQCRIVDMLRRNEPRSRFGGYPLFLL
jgi:hypothetical protein